jgi:hypothetical protein
MKSKTKIAKNKRYTPLKDEFGDELTLVEEEKGKCLIIFPINPHARDAFDEDLGLVAILMKYKIDFDDVYIRPLECVQDDNYDHAELVFEFDKKHINKIRSIEKTYFLHKIPVEAKGMASFLMSVVNDLEPKNWREGLISRYKTISIKGKKGNKLYKK